MLIVHIIQTLETANGAYLMTFHVRKWKIRIWPTKTTAFGIPAQSGAAGPCWNIGSSGERNGGGQLPKSGVSRQKPGLQQHSPAKIRVCYREGYVLGVFGQILGTSKLDGEFEKSLINHRESPVYGFWCMGPATARGWTATSRSSWTGPVWLLRYPLRKDMGVSSSSRGYPKLAGWFTMENPMEMDHDWGSPISGNHYMAKELFLLHPRFVVWITLQFHPLDNMELS